MPKKPRGGRRGGREAKAETTPKRKPEQETRGWGDKEKAPKQPRDKFSPAIADRICSLLSIGKSLRRICEEPGMVDIATIIRWLADPAKALFCAQYARAREAQADYLAEEILDISDDARNDFMETEDGPKLNAEAVQRSKLRVDARKWYASKLAPKKYGEKQEIEHSGTVKHAHLTLEEFDKRYAEAGGL